MYISPFMVKQIKFNGKITERSYKTKYKTEHVNKTIYVPKNTKDYEELKNGDQVKVVVTKGGEEL